MNNQDCINGCQHSIAEIDERLRELAPQYNRQIHREVIRREVDELLDQRNLVTRMMSELIMDEYVELMDGQSTT